MTLPQTQNGQKVTNTMVGRSQTPYGPKTETPTALLLLLHYRGTTPMFCEPGVIDLGVGRGSSKGKRWELADDSPKGAQKVFGPPSTMSTIRGGRCAHPCDEETQAIQPYH